MDHKEPVLYWVRRDFRLSDNRALTAAVENGRPVVFVLIRDQQLRDLGAAASQRYEAAVQNFSERLTSKGQRLILRSGEPAFVLKAVSQETGATQVVWNRLYDVGNRENDAITKAKLTEQGLRVRSFRGQLLFEPWDVSPASGPFYQVYSPFWRSVRTRTVTEPLIAPLQLPAPRVWPRSEILKDWSLSVKMYRGADVLAAHLHVGETQAQNTLHRFLIHCIAAYKSDRDYPSRPATSGLSEPLTYGEITPHQIWSAAQRHLQDGSPGAEHFLKELFWREFAYHLNFHTPHIETRNWRAGWDSFGWSATSPHLDAWKQGRTGVPLVDAAMRELYVTGIMHNRARMIVGSYLTKHMLVDWRVGKAWFQECLIDWDPASNAMGWQWVAGCGPDASPFFRIFNPARQQAQYDPNNTYINRWIAEGSEDPSAEAQSYFDAIPHSWSLSPNEKYPPKPVVDLAHGRNLALEAYQNHRAKKEKNVV